jgi:hypothetical protein
MTALWQPGVQYNNGDEVVYEGVRYRIIQPHRSQGDWTPPITPALWGRMQEDRPSGQHGGGGYGNTGSQPQQPLAPPKYDNQPTQGQGQHADQGHGHGNDSDSDDGKKSNKGKYLGIAAGVAAGAGLIGAGIFAYKHHEKSEEHKDELKQGYEKWVRDAQAATAHFNRDGPQGRPATWVLNHGKSIPQGAITTGREHSWNLYICRAFFDGGILLGKASDVFEKGGVIGYKDKEHAIDTYEILLGNMNQLKWVRTRGKLNLDSLRARPVEGGNENDGSPLYVAKAHHKGAEHPGKASEKLKGAYIPYGGGEELIEEYDVLCYQ